METKSHVSTIALFARALHKQGLVCAIKLIGCRFLKKDVSVGSKFSPVSINLRALHKDLEIFHSIHNAREYPDIIDPSVTLVIDAGAHVGIGSLRFAYMFPNAKILSIEPNQANFGALSKNVNPVSRIETINAAVWKSKTQLAIRNPDAADWAFQVIEDPAGPIRAVSLNDYIGESVGRIFVKLDIEGAEAIVLSENTQWLDRIDYLLIEVHDCFPAVFKALEQRSYSCRIVGEYLFFTFKK